MTKRPRRSERVELAWPTKHASDGPRPVWPLETLECHGAPGAGGPSPNRLIHGDNLQAMDALLGSHAGTIDLVYVDPPFLTGSEFRVRTLAGESGVVESHAYSDVWDGTAEYLAFLRPRLQRIRELLSPTGSLYVHVDPTVGHYVKVLVDEVFGPRSFQREIVWRIGWLSGYKTKARNWIRNHDDIYFYSKDPERFTFNKTVVPYPPGYRRRDGAEPKGAGVPLEDVWNANEAEWALTGDASLDSIQIKSFSREKTGYETQKNESLLRRIVLASSNPGDLVADFFCGSGTTLAVAEKLGRRWLGCDVGRVAIHTTRKRLLAIGDARPFELQRVSAADDVRDGSSSDASPEVRAERAGDVAVRVVLGDLPGGGPPDLIDAWSIDWDFRGLPFRSRWSAHRVRGRRGASLERASPVHVYERPGRYVIAVKLVDVFGHETERRIEWDATGARG